MTRADARLHHPDDARRWLAGGLCLQRVGAPRANDLGRVTSWLLATMAEVPSLPPPGLIADVGHLLDGRPLELGPLPPWADRLRAAIRVYEDRVLARLLGEARFAAASDAMARLAPNLRPAAVALVVGSLLDRIAFSSGTSVNPGLARRIAEKPADEILAEGEDALATSSAVCDRLAEGYEALATAAHGARSLCGDAEVFALENINVLKSLGQRVAIAQVMEASGELERTLPRRMKPRAESAGTTATQLEDESAYPIGGFSSMSTAGSLENLVTSELIYMDESKVDVDLFDMRYVEGELLYYTRDESLFVRRRRAIFVALDASLVDARWKDRELQWQRMVLTLGLVACLVRKLVEWLHEAELHFTIAFVSDGKGAQPLGPERGLLEILLGEWREKGMVEVIEIASLADVAARAREASLRAQTQVLLVGAPLSSWDAKWIDPRVEVGALSIERAPKWARWNAVPNQTDVSSEPWPAWSDALLEILRAVL